MYNKVAMFYTHHIRCMEPVPATEPPCGKSGYVTLTTHFAVRPLHVRAVIDVQPFETPLTVPFCTAATFELQELHDVRL